MTTTYHLERDDPAFMLGDAPVHQPDVAHRTLRACARRLGRIRRACRLVHGPGTWLPLRVYPPSCSRCPRAVDEPGYRTCSRCRRKGRQRRQRLKAAGVCTRCKSRPRRPDRDLCERCAAFVSARNRTPEQRVRRNQAARAWRRRQREARKTLRGRLALAWRVLVNR